MVQRKSVQSPRGQNSKTSKPANAENPFIHVPFARQDLSIPNTGGSAKKIHVPVDDEYRRSLVRSLDSATADLANDLARFPNALGPLVFTLREDAVAKTHRPLKLVEESGIQPAGHGGINEMLVAANAATLQVLRSVILTRTIHEIKANLSTIEKISAWSTKRRNPHGIPSLRKTSGIIVDIFQYFSEEATKRNLNFIESWLNKKNIKFSIIERIKSIPMLRIGDSHRVNDSDLAELISYPGLRHIYAEPQYSAKVTSGNVAVEVAKIPPPDAQIDAGEIPTVGVFDTGISNSATSLKPWVASKDIYVLPPETNYEHGTMVASLITSSGHMNDGHSWLPGVGCLIHDVCGLESNGAGIGILLERIKESVEKKPGIKIWNLSLGANQCSDIEFSEFAKELDAISDKFGVLFVVASGNYLDSPRRTWPPTTALSDRVSSPGESVRALTVGSVTHLTAFGSYTSVGEPPPYSRRGPGPVFTPKPDIVHAGGGVHKPWDIGNASIKALTPDNQIAHTFGTSFAAPIASNLAAHTWFALEGRSNLTPHPALVKALMIHAAQLSSPDYNPIDRRYFGAGRPDNILRTLYDSDDSFTLVFEAQLYQSMRWRKSPYPIPESLIQNGKFRGEVIITATYNPPLDGNAGSEYVRANIELGFGILSATGEFHGRVPGESEVGTTGYEMAQVEHGGKWAPVKIHRKRFPNGTEGTQWALQAGVNLRAFQPALVDPLVATIVVTLRSVDGNPNIYEEGVRALNNTSWTHTILPYRIPIIT
ncbi:S8 family anti-phage peptidase IteS [Burkholderia cepacia]|uniref:S8 family anti-phage peptidase IteS n=1 Tax=Burkholderia cepacia TaxID=292 RepID=UPI001C9324FD|nr:S8 family anti-phage peptidase IteS [Burkholderia cepacia]MBY4711654.1 S8 family peptidase [Burkholderia cepacia]MBY4736308.1 S8 family peptidase [Burkholderia cepacia]MBY4745611.1 S8 family peptidase [Burkholderia cepacia]MBY4760266.1 S8 family peptidase [Burkholderia cepacia]MBY4777182.1 S8 family peptidase [Burkholderia cepacia]